MPTSSFSQLIFSMMTSLSTSAMGDPVCGSDGETYNNACEAEVAGVEVVHEGACSDIPPVS
ncbi:MAG: Kazal-type serine protease inhibitor [Gammaproteobacteria bacterium]